MPRARLNGIELHHETAGAGMPLLAIHGGHGGAPSTLWQGPRFGERLAAILPRTRVIAPHRRGAGHSAYVPTAYTLVDVASDCLALLDHLAVERAVVAGISAGGMVALQLALSSPDRVSALVLLSTGANIMCARPTGIDAPYSGPMLDRLSTVSERATLLDLARRHGDRAAFESRREEFRTPPPGAAEVPEAELALRRSLVTLSEGELLGYAAGTLRNMDALLNVDLAPRLSELAMPALVMHGALDTTVPVEYGRALGSSIVQAHYVELPDAGHAVLREASSQRLLRVWVERSQDAERAGQPRACSRSSAGTDEAT